MIENNNYGALNNEQETANKIPSSNSAGSRQRFDIVEPNYNSTGCVIQKWTFKYTGFWDFTVACNWDVMPLVTYQEITYF